MAARKKHSWMFKRHLKPKHIQLEIVLSRRETSQGSSLGIKIRGEGIRILQDLVALSPGLEVTWFATAKDLGEFALALELAGKSPCDPKTLNRAAMKHLESKPEFTLEVALVSLRWLCEGYGYEITSLDVLNAFRACMAAAEKLGRQEATLTRIRELLNGHSHDGGFVRNV